MLANFEKWINEVQEEAINIKKEQARTKGDQTNWEEQVWKSSEKNKALKEKFALEGTKLNYKPRPYAESGAKEWLYDFVWRDFDSDDNLLSVPLAMEIEMSSRKEGGLKYDFYKLLQADSEYKIFIFQNNNESEVKEHFKLLNQAIDKYNSKSSSEYLFAGWSMNQNRFYYNRRVTKY